MLRNLLALTLILSLGQAATAADHVVNPDGSGPYPTIAAAVAASANGDRVLLNAGTFTGPGNRGILVNRDIEIRAAGDPLSVTIDCEGVDRAFRLEYADVVFWGLVITGGHVDGDGGAVHQEEGRVYFQDCVLRDNSATGDGGAAYVFEAGYLTVENTVLDGNQAGGWGGGLYMHEETALVLQSSTLILNGADQGGHVFVYGNNLATANRSVLAYATGGGAVRDYYGTMTLTCSDVWGNHGLDYYGPLQGQNGVDGNLNVDPELADPMADPPVYGPIASSPIWTGSSCGWMGATGAVGGYDTPVYGVAADSSGMFLTMAEALVAVPDRSLIMLEDGVYRGEGFDELDPGTKNLRIASRSGDPAACVFSRPVGRFEPIMTFAGGQTGLTRLEGLGFTSEDENSVTQGQPAVDISGPVGMQLIDCRFEDVFATYGRGMLNIEGEEGAPATVSLSGCAFEMESVRSPLLTSQYWTVDMEGCSLEGQIHSGVLIGLELCPGGSMIDCSLDGRGRTDMGMLAVSVLNQALPFQFTGCHFVGASDTGIDLGAATAVAFSSCHFHEPGSGIMAHSELEIDGPGPVTFENCTFDGLSPEGGRKSGAIDSDGTDLVLSECTIAQYYAPPGGGGIRVRNADLSLTEVRIEDCEAGSDGGAILVESGQAVLTDCRLANNLASSQGGAIKLNNARANLFYCDLVDNVAWRGGAVSIEADTGPMESRFENVIIADNQARDGSAAVEILGQEASLILAQCTLVGNELLYDFPADELYQVVVGNGAHVFLEHSLITHAPTAGAVTASAHTTPGFISAYCTNIWGNAGGDWVGDLAGMLGDDENISASPLYCDRSAGIYSVHAASPCLPDHNACSTQIGARGLGCGDPAVGVEQPALPSSLALAGAYPNPFNPRTTVRYALPAAGPVTLAIHDVTGRLVRVLVDGRVEAAGRHEVMWDGRDDRGRGQASGLYLVRLVAGGEVRQGRMTLLR